MALIKCSECRKDISDKALVCPNCGNPIKDQNVAVQISAKKDPMQIDPVFVSKKWKLVKLVAWGSIIVGVILMLGGGFDFNKPIVNIGTGIAFFGLIELIVGKVGAWYEDRRAR